MKLNVVENNDGPLSRSIAGRDEGTQHDMKQTPATAKYSGVAEAISCVEKHLGMSEVTSTPSTTETVTRPSNTTTTTTTTTSTATHQLADLVHRLKRVEEQLVAFEKTHPEKARLLYLSTKVCCCHCNFVENAASFNSRQ
jgi:hypothetical protein